jgi:hypothetical protein
VTEEKQRESDSGRTIADELNELGQQLSAALKAVWESEERQELQQEISEGVKALGSQIEEAVQSARDSEALEEAKSDVRQAVEKARQSDVVQDLRQGLMDLLQGINRELNKLTSSSKAESAGETEPGTEEPAGGS